MDAATLSQLGGVPGGGGDVNSIKAAHEQQQKNEEKRSEVLGKVLDPQAQQRLDTLRLVKADKVRAIEDRVLHMAGTGQLQSQVNDAMMKQMLEAMGGEDTTKKAAIQLPRGRFDDSDDE